MREDCNRLVAGVRIGAARRSVIINTIVIINSRDPYAHNYL